MPPAGVARVVGPDKRHPYPRGRSRKGSHNPARVDREATRSRLTAGMPTRQTPGQTGPYGPPTESAADWTDRGTPRHIRAGRAARQAPRGSAVRCRAVRRRLQVHYSGWGTDRGTPRFPRPGPQAGAGAGRRGALQECLPALDPATLRGRIGRRADRPGPKTLPTPDPVRFVLLGRTWSYAVGRHPWRSPPSPKP